MTLCVLLELPYPPSVNRYWRSSPVSRKTGADFRKALKQTAEPGWGDVQRLVGVRVTRSAEGNAYRASVASRCMVARVRGQLAEQPLIGILDCRVVAFPPVLVRRRDLDNLWKALLDSLTYAGVILDDSQFTDTRIRWGAPSRKPFVRVALGRPSDESDDAFLQTDRPRETLRRGRTDLAVLTQGDLLEENTR